MWLRTDEAAKRLGKSVETIRRWARQKKLSSKLEPNSRGQSIMYVDISSVFLKMEKSSAVIQCSHFQQEAQKKFASVQSVRSKSNFSAVSAVTEKDSSAVIFDDTSGTHSNDHFDHPDLAPHSDLPEDYLEIGRLKAMVCLEALNKIDSGMNKVDVYKIVSEAYNLGLIAPDLLEKRGRLSARTLQTWLKIYLDNGKDYTALAPQYLASKIKGRDITAKEEQFLIKFLLNPRKIKIGMGGQVVLHFDFTD
jgi:Helix-turn-helix domain